MPTQNSKYIIKATIVLHNLVMLSIESDTKFSDEKIKIVVDKCNGLQRKHVLKHFRFASRNSAKGAMKMRNEIADYFIHNNALS